MYGGEIWGYQKQRQIEQVHIAFCKFFLGLSGKSSNMAALGECGRYPMYVTLYIKCIKYWLAILQLPEHRYPKQIYNMLREQDSAGRVTWASHIKSLLGAYGYNEVWQNQAVANQKSFLAELREKIEQKFKDEWREKLNSLDKLCTYRDLKQEWGTESYVVDLQDFRLRKALAKFRCSNHNLRIERQRYGPLYR